MDIGEHCNNKECNRLDFLPIKCPACKNNFCSDHYKYSSHNCASATPEQLQDTNKFLLPTCPICDKQVPFVDGSRNPDDAITSHIDNGCKNKKKEKIYSNVCSKKGCKKKEVVPIKCKECEKVFCLKHRLKEDHSCVGRQAAQREARLKKFGATTANTNRRMQIPAVALAAPGFSGSANRNATSSDRSHNQNRQNNVNNSNPGLYPEQEIDRQTQEQLDLELAVQLQQSYQNEATGGGSGGVVQRSGNSSRRRSLTGQNNEKCTIS